MEGEGARLHDVAEPGEALLEESKVPGAEREKLARLGAYSRRSAALAAPQRHLSEHGYVFFRLVLRRVCDSVQQRAKICVRKN